MKKLVTYTLIPLIAPAIIVVFIGQYNLSIPADRVVSVLTSWVTPVLALPYMAGLVFIIKRRVQKLLQLSESKQYAQFGKMYKSTYKIFFISVVCYGLLAIPIALSVGSLTQEVIYATVNSVAFILISSIPVLIQWTNTLDSLFEGTPMASTYTSHVKSKFLGISSFIAIGGTGLLISSISSLLWRYTEFPEYGITTDTIMIRLTVISIGIVAFIIIPLAMLGSNFSARLQQMTHFIIHLSNKDLKDHSNISSRDEFGLAGEYLNAMNENFRSVLKKLRENNHYLKNSSTELSGMSGAISDASSNQAASSEEIAASVEEMSANIAMSTENATKSAANNKISAEYMIQGQALMDQTLKNILSISEKVKEIEDIAGQTNLLAINAFIEAANAGEHGKGFAVVARDVRDLADRSKEAAYEITRMAKESLNSSTDTKLKIDDVVVKIKESSDLAFQIEEASKEQQQSSEQINASVQTFNNSSQQMATSAEELAATSNELADKAKNLEMSTKDFKL
ncbi:MAG: hypothetical protein JXQ90_05700 [Cyclobacteriaceae bacterium]